MKFNTKNYGGFTAETAEEIVLDSGAIFKDFEFGTDDYDTALQGGKLLGTTQGGATINIVPEMRSPQIDGLKAKGKGLQYITTWAVSLVANVVTLTTEFLHAALVASKVAVGDLYETITVENYISETSYINNLTLVAKVTGTQEPIIFQIFNALNTAGIVTTLADSAEAVVPVTFEGHVDLTDAQTRDQVPCAIHRPKSEGNITGTVTDTATPVKDADVEVTIGTKTFAAVTNDLGEFTIYAVPYGAGYTVTATKDAKSGTATNITVIAGQDNAAGDIAIA